jgi:hypothetical protein
MLSVGDQTGQHDTSSLLPPKYLPEELIGKTFVCKMDNGNTYHAQIIQKMIDCDAEKLENIKFLVNLGNGDFDEIITFNTLSTIRENQLDEWASNADAAWIFQGIKSHHGPITSNNPYYSLLVEWEDVSETLEPLDPVIKDYPISVANYAHQNNFLDTPGWTRIISIVLNKN